MLKGMSIERGVAKVDFNYHEIPVSLPINHKLQLRCII
jgi:hypothetical protein